MASVERKPRIDADITLRLNEAEMRALDALMGYGFDPFVNEFFKVMGKAYLEPHVGGLRSLFDARGHIRSALHRLDAARKAFAEKVD